MIEPSNEVVSVRHPVNLNPGIIERFWKWIDKNGPIPEHAAHLGNCWICTKTPHPGGYCYLTIYSRAVGIHRVSYIHHSGSQVPDGLFVLHKCDNRICVNPSHLFLGTLGENNRDRDSKGRTVTTPGDAHWTRKSPHLIKRGAEHWSRTQPEKLAASFVNRKRRSPESYANGERIAAAKLTAEKVIEIRKLRAQGVRLRDIAFQFGVYETLVSMIANRKAWKHVP